MLLLLGVVVLVVACINYANLATARAVDHVRDVGIRKFLGARPRHIAAQYLLDAGLVTGAGALVALVLIALLVPVFAATSGIDLRIALLDGAQSLEFFILLLVIVTLAAGAYPALVLSRLRPVWALHAGNTSLGSRLFSTALVGVQFAIASLLSIAAVLTYLQNQELRRTGLQATQDPHVIIENFYTATHLNPDTLRAELLRFPQVLSVSSMAKPPWTGVNVLPLSRSPDESLSQRSAVWYTVGHDFFSTAGMRLLAGRSFLPEHGDDALPFLQDPQRPNSIVIDRALMEELGFRSPEEAVGELIYVPTGLMAGFGGNAAQPLRIVGVVENKPLTIAGIGPRGAVYSFADPLPFLIVRIERADVTGALEGIDATWRRLVPNVALRRRFADDIFNESYASFARINRTFSALALFAVLICAIGLFAMATQVTSRRRREIAIRKTLGASTRQIVLLLLRSFAVPIIVANIVAWPVAYNAARAYLGAFVAPIALTPTPFVLCLLSTLLIVAVAVGGQTLRAARLRPSVTPL
jgi:putative ABC transport system permease protein